jgi:hypothetical protein
MPKRRTIIIPSISKPLSFVCRDNPHLAGSEALGVAFVALPVLEAVEPVLEVVEPVLVVVFEAVFEAVFVGGFVAGSAGVFETDVVAGFVADFLAGLAGSAGIFDVVFVVGLVAGSEEDFDDGFEAGLTVGLAGDVAPSLAATGFDGDPVAGFAAGLVTGLEADGLEVEGDSALFETDFEAGFDAGLSVGTDDVVAVFGLVDFEVVDVVAGVFAVVVPGEAVLVGVDFAVTVCDVAGVGVVDCEVAAFGVADLERNGLSFAKAFGLILTPMSGKPNFDRSIPISGPRDFDAVLVDGVLADGVLVVFEAGVEDDVVGFEVEPAADDVGTGLTVVAIFGGNADVIDCVVVDFVGGFVGVFETDFAGVFNVD